MAEANPNAICTTYQVRTLYNTWGKLLLRQSCVLKSNAWTPLDVCSKVKCSGYSYHKKADEQ